MSTESGPGQIITVYVGRTARAFHVHLSKLGPVSNLLDSSKSSSAISLPNENEESFNAIVNWIYNGPLPRAANISEYVINAKTLESPSEGNTLVADFSWGKYLSTTISGRGRTSTVTATAKSGDSLLKEALSTQCMLLDIMMMAERWRWEKLYNAAIDAFRDGERNLRRERPSLLHIKVVYLRTSAGSPLREFLGDYAYSLAKANKNMSFYLKEGWFERLPDFLEDIMRRMDGKGPFTYPLQRRSSKDGEFDKEKGKRNNKEILAEEAPLDLAATTYHVHGGHLVLDCQRSGWGSCAVE
ncbi:hypothetical protein ONZ43_g3865 [Nemania bipapillata]|uniref:Uncharacterized protein n=1 Tax=Nemania bipapillata TaxID=110536 RepID=A0ACC2IV21_9PEZI|nr:hypothetical protein ONZ43_g3865 [Nemania bipapillata]